MLADWYLWRTFCFIAINLEVKLQEEALNIPGTVDKLLSDYATRFNEIKTPRKLLWKKNLGTVKVRHFKFHIMRLGHFFSPYLEWVSTDWSWVWTKNDIWSFYFSWSCNLKIERFSSRSLLYMLLSLCNFKIKQGNLMNHFSTVIHISREISFFYGVCWPRWTELTFFLQLDL